MALYIELNLAIGASWTLAITPTILQVQVGLGVEDDRSKCGNKKNRATTNSNLALRFRRNCI